MYDLRIFQKTDIYIKTTTCYTRGLNHLTGLADNKATTRHLSVTEVRKSIKDFNS